MAVAAWIRYVGGVDEKGAAIDVRDPMATLLKTTIDSAGASPNRRVAEVLGLGEIFGSDLSNDPEFLGSLVKAYSDLIEFGAMKAVAKIG